MSPSFKNRLFLTALSALLVLLVLFAMEFWPVAAQTSFISLGPVSAPITGSGNNETNSVTQYHQLVWRVSGTVSSCTVALDSSSDGVTWSSGGVISGQTCTSNGSSSVVNSVVNFVRINVTTLTGGGTVTIVYSGYNTNPGGGGSTTGPSGTPTTNDILTSTGTANQVQDPGGCTLTSSILTCPSGVAGQFNGTLSVGGSGSSNNFSFAGAERFYSNATRDLRLQQSSTDKFQWLNGPYALDQTTGVLCWTIGGCDTGISRCAAGVTCFGTGAQGNTAGTAEAAKYQTSTVCTSSASPAVCGSSAAGFVAIPTGATPTLTVNTSAVTANSQIFLQVDESLGTALSVTCNTTLATLVNPVVTARSAGTSFTFTINSTLVTNPACISYTITN